MSKKIAKLYLITSLSSEFTPLFHCHCFLNLHISWNTAKSFRTHFLCHSAILPTRPQYKAKALIISHPCKSLQRFTATSRPSKHLWLWPCAIFKAIPTSIPSTYSSSNAWNLLPSSVFQILHILGLRSVHSFWLPWDSFCIDPCLCDLLSLWPCMSDAINVNSTFY